MIGLISRDVPGPFPKPPRSYPSYSHWTQETERSYQYRCSNMSVPRYTSQRFSRRRDLSCGNHLLIASDFVMQVFVLGVNVLFKRPKPVLNCKIASSLSFGEGNATIETTFDLQS